MTVDFVVSAIVVNRSRLSWALVVHVIFALLMAFRLSVAIYVFAGVRPPRFLQRLRLPPATNWEFTWLIGSVVTCLVGLLAVKRRKPVLVRLYIARKFAVFNPYTTVRATCVERLQPSEPSIRCFSMYLHKMFNELSNLMGVHSYSITNYYRPVQH
jgi:hypothetical protein